MAHATLVHGSKVLAADTLVGDKVVNLQKEDPGKIEHLMIDLESGRIAYAVLSFGGFLGMGDKLFAIPWSNLTVDKVEKRFILNVKKELLEHAPGFDKDHWPNTADQVWGEKLLHITAPSLNGIDEARRVWLAVNVGDPHGWP